MYCQNPNQIKGRVFDIETLQPLQNATVIIAGSSIGVATNSEGAFELNVPDEYADSLIQVSYVGYKPLFLTLSGDPGNQIVYLEPLDIVLGEVLVRSRKTDAEDIVNKAIWSIPENYESEINNLKCFYREITYINNKEANVTEALLNVYKPPYKWPRDEDLVKVSKVRHVSGNQESGFEFEGGAYYRISDDVIANRPEFIKRESLHYFKFETTRVLGTGDESILVISFEPDQGAINRELADYLGRYKDTYDKTLLLYSGELFINKKDYAIVKIDYWLRSDKLRYALKRYLTKIPDESIVSLRKVRFSAEYRKHKDRYFLSSTNGQINFRVGNESLGRSYDYRVYNELLTVDRTTHGVQKFPASEITGNKDLVPDYQEKYKADFWKDENIVQAYSRLYSLGDTDVSDALFIDRLKLRLDELRTNRPVERLFLHTDRNRYLPGDEIYFKAYVKEEYTGFPSFLSKSFFVLLADSTGNVLKQTRFSLKSGTGHGNMRIPREAKRGMYKIISYPGFVQNFEPGESYVQSIMIEDELSFFKGTSQSEPRERKPRPTIGEPDIQFLPEGGNLISGRQNNIAVCAITEKATPLVVKMQLKDENHNILDTIETNSAGLGSFRLKPKENLRYYTSIIEPADYRNKRYDIPEAADAGVNMEVIKNEQDHIYLRLNSNSNLAERLQIILVKDSEILCSVDKEIRGVGFADLHFENLSAGIATLSVFKREEPVAERLIFLDSFQRLNVSGRLEYGAYPIRGKMKIKVKVTDQEGNPVKAYLSATVIDSINCISDQLSMPDIRYSFWLRSGLKKNTPVQIPVAVLNRIGPEETDLISDINLLLLTYGWRKYTAGSLLSKNKNEFVSPLINYDIIRGQVVPLNKRRRRVSAKELQVFEPKTFYQKTVFTDKTGSFSSRPESFLLDKELIWNFSNEKMGRKWKISLESPEDSVFRENAGLIKPLDFAGKDPDKRPEAEAPFDPGIYMQHFIIPEVTVSAERSDRMAGRKRLANSIENLGNMSSGSPEDFNAVPDLLSLIYKVKMPKRVSVIKPEEEQGILWKCVYYWSPVKSMLSESDAQESPALFVINDYPFTYNIWDLPHITPEIIDEIKIMSGPQAHAFFGAKALGGAIMIYTKEPGLNFQTKNDADPGLLIMPPICNTVKEFYSPAYEEESTDFNKADFRLTFHWEPELVTNDQGEATFEYFNAGYNSYAKVIIQGMSASGEPCIHTMNYRVIRDRQIP